MKKLSCKKIHIIILILGSIFVSLSIFHKSLWFDETYSVAIANHNFLDIWKIGGHDVHPVLYYWMLRIVNLLTSGSILAYRIFSVVPIILLGVIGYTHIRKDFGEKVGIFFTFFSLFIPASTLYANQIRMYSWAILILTLFFIYSYRLYKGEKTIKNWLIFFVLSLSSLYIHYYGLMAAGITNLLLLIYFIKGKDKKSIRNLIILGIAQVILYVPWIIYFVGQLEHVSEGFWIALGLKDITYIIGEQFVVGENPYVCAVFAIIMYIYIISFIKRKRKEIDVKPVIIASAIYLMVIIAALFISIFLHTAILYHRYLFVITGLYIFVVSFILSKEKNKYIIGLICLVTISFGIANCIYQIKGNYDEQNLAAVNYLKENIEEDDEIIYRNIGIGSIIAVNFDNKQYFYNPEDWNVEEAYKAYSPQMDTYLTDEFIENLPDRVWVIDTWDESVYNDFFKNSDYKIVKQSKFKTDYYEEYGYDIKLLEKVE